MASTSTPSTWTIRSLLAWIASDFAGLGIPSPRLDAELLIGAALGLARVKLYLDLDRPLRPDELAKVRALVVRRRKREPVAYIVGEREFYRRSFEVTPAVLIPRPDTETLIERALELLPAGSPARVLDLCTGSGAIAVTLAAERPETHVIATDLSAAALDVARRNAARHGVSERCEFLEGDLFAPLSAAGRFELIVANPPYIPEAEIEALQAEIKQYEPRLALASGSEGLTHLERLCAQTGAFLEPGGAVLFEVGQRQAEPVRALLEAAGFVDVTAHKDLGGIERVVEGHAPKDSP
jgi:release factor glutamine methyltransferase